MATFDDYIIRITERGSKEAAASIGVLGKESERTEGFVASLNRTLFALGSAFSVKTLLDITDKYQAMNNQLKLVTKSSEELKSTQDRLYAQAQNGRTNLEALTELYVKLKMSQKEVNVSSENLFRVTDLVSKSLALSGRAGQASANGLRQFVQGLVSGKIQGEELRSILENTPYLAKVLADGLRVPIGALRELGAQGKLTSQAVVDAILRMSDSINKDFSKTTLTIGQSITVFENAFTRFIGQSGETSTAAGLVAAGIVFLSQNIDKLALALGVATAAWIAYRVALVAVAAAQTAANFLIAANPIVRFAVIIGTVVTAMILLSNNTSSYTAILKSMGEVGLAAFNYIKDGILGTIEFFTNLGTTATSVAESITNGFVGGFQAIWEFITGWYNYIVDLIGIQFPNAVSSAVNSVVKFFTDGFNSIKEFVNGIIKYLTDAISTFVNNALAFFNKIIDAAAKAIAAVRGGGGDTTEIAGGRASGGPVSANKKYLVGENGPELFIPGTSGLIVPNGGDASSFSGGSGDSGASRTTIVNLLAEGVAQATEGSLNSIVAATEGILSALEKSASTSSSSSSSSSSDSPGNGSTSAINNFLSGVSSTVTTGSSGGSSTSSSMSAAVAETVPSTNKNYWVNLLAKAYLDEYTGLRSGSQSRVPGILSQLPSDMSDEIIKAAQYKTFGENFSAEVNFRSGGGFTVPGSTGVDSKLIGMRVSPGEQVDVRTRKQMREEAGTSGGTTNNITFVVQTPDADSFRKSEKQISRDLLNTLVKATG